AWQDPDNPTPREKIAAYDGFSAYCGRYEIDERAGMIYHLPDVASFPYYVGTRRPRPYSFHGDRLTFAAKVTDEPGVASYVIVWQKMVATTPSEMRARGAESIAELRSAMERRRQASMSGHAEAVAASMMHDYMQTDVSGYVQDKQAWLDEYFLPLSELI